MRLRNESLTFHVKEALLVPEEGIVDYSKVSAVMVDKIREAGGEILLGTEVQGANDTSSHVAISTSAGVFEGRVAIFCAGLQSDRLAKMCGNRFAPRSCLFVETTSSSSLTEIPSGQTSDISGGRSKLSFLRCSFNSNYRR